MGFRIILVSLSIASLGASLGLSPLAGAKPVPFTQGLEEKPKFDYSIRRFLQPRFGQQEEKPKVDYSKSGSETVLVPFGVELLEEKTMPLDLVNYDLAHADTRIAHGVRLFATPVGPGQTLTLSLKATPLVNYRMNWILPLDKSDPLYSKIKLAIDNQLKRQSPTISLKNATKEPCLVSFVVHGMAEQPYSVKIGRK